MYFIHAFSAVESEVLVTMVVDCFIPICKPLQYPLVLMIPMIVKKGVSILLWGWSAWFSWWPS